MATKKRFYKSVASVTHDGDFLVQLDGQDVRSPAGSRLCLPNFELASVIADEWRSQGEEIDPSSMPLHSLAVTVVDRVTPQRNSIIVELSAYGGNDLLCYRDENDYLANLQQKQWQPLLDHLAKNHGIYLQTVAGIMPVFQPDAAKFLPLIEAYDDWRLGMLHRATSLSGSLVLGLNFVDAVIDDKTIFSLGFLDELWQNEKWGTDFEAAARHRFIRIEFQDVARFLSLLGKKGSS